MNIVEIFKKIKLKIISYLRKKFINPKTEFYIISFPKSGRTWLRFFLSKYFYLNFNRPEGLDFRSFFKNKKIPRIGFTHCEAHKKNKFTEVKIIVKKFYEKKVIFLYRDPRDVIVSHYFQYTKKDFQYNKDVEKKITLSDFIRHPKLGISRIVYFMNFVYEQKDFFNKFIMISYEDCQKDAFVCFNKILNFLDIKNINENCLKEAIQESSFSKMKKVESQNELNDERLKPTDVNDAESYKVRKGKIGGYKEYLNSEDISYVNGEIKKLNKIFKYNLD